MTRDDSGAAVQRLAVLVAALLGDLLDRIATAPLPSPELVEQVVQIFGPTLDALVHKAARPGDSATARRPRRDAASGGYLSVAQLATHLGRSPRWVKDRVRPGAKERLPHRRVSANRPPDFSPEHVAWIDRHYSVAASAAPEQVLAGLDPTLRARSRRALAVTPRSTQAQQPAGQGSDPVHRRGRRRDPGDHASPPTHAGGNRRAGRARARRPLRGLPGAGRPWRLIAPSAQPMQPARKPDPHTTL